MILNKINNFLFIIFILFITLFAQCSTDYYYNSEVGIPKEGWDYNKAAIFETDIQDSSQVFNLIFELGNTDEYRYSNIWFFVRTTSPKGISLRDTLEYFISKKDGEWVGKKNEDIWISKMYFKNSVRFQEQGKYKFEIWQGMREDTLKGITKIGLLMEKL